MQTISSVLHELSFPFFSLSLFHSISVIKAAIKVAANGIRKRDIPESFKVEAFVESSLPSFSSLPCEGERQGIKGASSSSSRVLRSATHSPRRYIRPLRIAHEKHIVRRVTFPL